MLCLIFSLDFKDCIIFKHMLMLQSTCILLVYQGPYCFFM